MTDHPSAFALRGAFERTATNKLPLLVLRPIFQA